MHSRNLIYLVAAVGIALVIKAVAAQDPEPLGLPVVNTAVAAPAVTAEEPEMIFEREVFVYQRGSRRDPFKPLTDNMMGPLFETLSLRMIIHSTDPTASIAVVADNNQTYRVRRGQVVGNARVVSIEKDRVVFTVEELGNYRQEILELKPEN